MKGAGCRGCKPTDKKEREHMHSQPSHKDTLISTACWIAVVRARESERADRLFNDPWAAGLAGEEGPAWWQRTTGGKDENEVGLAIRTRFFDDFLLEVTREHAVRQVVIAAAGMDTRAFRLTWPPQTHLFELDLSPIFVRKEPLLSTAGAVPTCQRHEVPVDLSDASWSMRCYRLALTRASARFCSRNGSSSIFLPRWSPL